MKPRIVTAATIALTVGLLASAPAGAVTLALSDAVLAGGASLIGGPKIQFDANTSGQSATWTFASIPGQEYIITVTGHSNNSTSFFNFFIDADGPGALTDFVQLGGDISLSGFSTIALPSFIDLGTTDYFRIVNGGSGRNSGGQIDVVDLSITAVPGPVVGAGLPAFLMALGGLVILSRRRRKLGGVA
jgi:hypothetical protein